MDKINACIISFFMNNIDKKTVDIQRQVVDKYNTQKYPHYSILTDLRHGAAMDMAWALHGINHPTFDGHNVPKRFDHDAILFLDIDAIPLNPDAIHDTIKAASEGHLIGNVQRTNHLQNNQHLFVAPSCLAVSVDTFVTIGKPSGLETKRSDVAEEYTFAAEKSGIVPIDFYLPLCYNEAPAEGGSWALKDGMPVYGRHTTFGMGDIPMFWHSFQIFHPGMQEKFWKKCEEVLAIESK